MVSTTNLHPQDGDLLLTKKYKVGKVRGTGIKEEKMSKTLE